MSNKGMKLQSKTPGICAYCYCPFEKPGVHSKYCSISCAVWSRVDRKGVDECWPWTGGTVNGGYGAGTFDGQRYRATRVIMDEQGHDIDGLFVLHRCDNPPCCNPAHLFLGTPADNMTDKTAKGRGKSISPALKGESHGRARLTAEDVLFMRANPRIGCTELGKMFGVPKDTAWKVLNGKTWKHLL
jgi:hypothetical protein